MLLDTVSYYCSGTDKHFFSHFKSFFFQNVKKQNKKKSWNPTNYSRNIPRHVRMESQTYKKMLETIYCGSPARSCLQSRRSTSPFEWMSHNKIIIILLHHQMKHSVSLASRTTRISLPTQNGKRKANLVEHKMMRMDLASIKKIRSEERNSKKQ